MKNSSIVVILINRKTGEKAILRGKNIITDAGDLYYAQKACGEIPTDAFANLYLATAGPATPAKDDNYGDFTVAAESEKAPSAGYPKTNDDDPDNTGAGVDVISWKFTYVGADGPFADITHSFIAKAGAGGTDPILNSYKWPEVWGKEAGVICKVFINHPALGVAL